MTTYTPISMHKPQTMPERLEENRKLVARMTSVEILQHFKEQLTPLLETRSELRFALFDTVTELAHICRLEAVQDYLRLLLRP